VTRLAAAGPAKLFLTVPVKQKVAFLTIDDGWVHDNDAIALLRAAHIPVTLFLTTNAVTSDPSYFAKLQAEGAVIEDHTITHSDLAKMNYPQQYHEICGSAAQLATWYHRHPVLMRAPYGDSNANTLKAAASCGIRAAVYWDEMVVNGKVEYQRPGGIHPGDMILMHFKDQFDEDFLAAVTAMYKSGVTPALLDDYLVTTPPTPITPALPSPAFSAGAP
jgi:peptidoglycan/xylan/chitin deacetylase (PgdA/CDA1 family)